MAEGADRRQQVVESIAGSDQRQPGGHQSDRHRQGQLGVGAVFVGFVALDRGVGASPGHPFGADRVKIADNAGGCQPGGEGVIERAVGSDHQRRRGMAATACGANRPAPVTTTTWD